MESKMNREILNDRIEWKDNEGRIYLIQTLNKKRKDCRRYLL